MSGDDLATGLKLPVAELTSQGAGELKLISINLIIVGTGEGPHR